MPLPKQNLVNALEVDNLSHGIFGVCYSVLTWSGVAKGLGLNPRSWLKSVGKLIEDGHATTFLYVRSSGTLTMTGISDDGWEFYSADDWARTTTSARTYVYYINVDQNLIDRYNATKKKLRKKRVSYAVIFPNTPVTSRYENCVSHSHYLMHELGLGSWIKTKGWWMPSASNWLNWFSSFIPTNRNGFRWKYRHFANTNTHIP